MFNFKKSSFLKSTITLASGSVISQLIVLLVSPILTRLYTPSEFGSYTYLLSIIAIFMGVINGRYEMSIVTEKNKRNVFALILLSTLIGFVFTVIITLIYFLYSYFQNTSIRIKFNYLIFVFLTLLSYSIINVLTSYNNRIKEYKVISSVSILRAGSQNIGSTILGLFKLGEMGLLIPYVIGQYLGIGQQLKSLKSNFLEIKKVKKKDLIHVAKLHYRQPLYSAPSVFVNSCSYSSITFFSEALFGLSTVGFYSLSVRILGLPLALISGNIAKVFFESASREKENTGQFYLSLKKAFLFQLILAIPMVLFMIFLSTPICEFVFGKQWGIAGKYIAILAPMFGIRFIVSAMSSGPIVANKQSLDLFLQSVFLIISFMTFFISKIYSLSMETYLSIISIAFSALYAIYMYYIYKFSRQITVKS